MSERVMGRPSLLDNKKELIARIMEYIDNHTEHEDLVPSVEGLAYFLDVSRKTIYNWSNSDDDILHTLDRLNAKQSKMLISGGLSNAMNSTISKLMLANHGYSEKQEVQHSGRIDSNQNIKQITADMSADEATRIYQDMLNGTD
jgi:DNA-packaging protein gp3